MSSLIIGGNGYVGGGISKVLEKRGIKTLKTSRSVKLDSQTIILDLNSKTLDIDNYFSSNFPISYFKYVVLAGGFTTYIEKSKMGEIPDEVVKDIIDSNFLSAYRILSLVERNHSFSPTCKVVIISSTAGLYAQGSNIVYSAMKSAVNSLVKSSSQWIRKDQKVISLCPGLLAGGMTRNAPAEYINYWKEIYPDGKLPTAEDVGVKVAELLFNEDIQSGYICELEK